MHTIAARFLLANLGVVLALLALPEGAMAQSAADFFQAGNLAFEAGDYESAITEYLSARTAGYDGPELAFNLGAAYFRANRFDEAEQVFAALSDDSRFSAVAFYNLGLVAYARGDHSLAEANFVRTAELAPASSALGRAARQGLERIASSRRGFRISSGRAPGKKVMRLRSRPLVTGTVS